MIHPRYMRDHELIAELQGWLVALSERARRVVMQSKIPYGLSTSQVRFKEVQIEFSKRMQHDLPRPGTKEEIEEEQERMQRIAGRHAVHG